MFNKISLKTKIVIFLIASLIGVFSIIYNTKDNWNFNIVNKTKKASSEVNNVKKVDSDKVKTEEDAKKELDVLWQKGADLFNREDNSKDCILIMDDIIAKNDKYYQAYSLKGLALCYLKPQGKYTEGMQNIDKALEIKPDYGYGRFCKALAFELFGKYDEAIIAYNRAIEVEKYVWSYYGLASVYGRKGDVENAVKNLRIATTMNSPEDNQLIKNEAIKEADFDNVRDSKEFQDLLK